jgi:polyisoprenoid-binding protein YceI
MPRFDQSTAKCLVFTYKEGLLSSIAHDLRIEATRFSIETDVDGPSVRAELDASSLRVQTAMKNGRPHDGLGDKDKREIEKNIREDVLHAKRHASIRFESTAVTRDGDAYDVEGDLTLHGTTRRFRARAEPEGALLVTQLTVHQPDFGIKPYRAALGTLRVQADVTIRVSVPR